MALLLYGGTAIALRLGIAPSVYFDFFTDKLLDKAVLQSAFPFLQRSTVSQEEPNAYIVLVPCGTTQDQNLKVSFFGSIGFGRIGERPMNDDDTLRVGTLDDLMATKVKGILQRVEAKDYRGRAARVKAGVSLSKGLSAVRPFSPTERELECDGVLRGW